MKKGLKVIGDKEVVDVMDGSLKRIRDCRFAFWVPDKNDGEVCMEVFHDYAYYYNLFYGDKNYAAEAKDL